jgi:hypothetical protein
MESREAFSCMVNAGAATCVHERLDEEAPKGHGRLELEMVVGR